ncbi:MAG: exodeoxyribonuclease V subunit alpha [Rudaea sp.]|nr:exodeoxyribonuclease V subunit alpha [Rudaea sp.]
MSAATPAQTADARAIDHALARWVRERSGSELVARAAHAVSIAEGQGDACAALAEDAGFSADDIDALHAHAWVGDGREFSPFVLDRRAHFYTWRNWRHESRLAEAIRERAGARTLPVAVADIAADLGELFSAEDEAATCWQRVAVAAAPGSRLFVLTGGPGTGKTTTVVRLLLMLLRHAAASGLAEKPVIALAAPTGKAAQRLAQAMAKGKQNLLERLPSDSEFRALLDRIPHAEAGTLHRLLGYRPMDNTFARGVADPLAADIVVVDEASMVDLAMMRQLVDALRSQTMLILLGDPGQLAAVEAGSVLSDIVASVDQNALPLALAQRLVTILQPPPVEAIVIAPLAGQVVTLTHVWRAGSGLQRGIAALRVGDTAWLDAFIANGVDGSLRLQICAAVQALSARIDAWIDAHESLFGQLLAPAIAPAAALKLLREAQVLCALREGAFGAQYINALIARRLSGRFGFDATQAWYHGRPILVTRNDYARSLFNGDIGIVLLGDGGPRVWFELSTRDGSPGLRSFSPRTLPAHDTAFAITIHRSQGSEYGDVAVVLPPDAEHRVLSRELLYTAVSRATHGAEIWATADAMRAAAMHPIRRRGGLLERLRRVRDSTASDPDC